ncbi:MAG: UV DNA damage repair endonuclease UvsE [candidate division WOR-3 bacterium]
MAIRVGYPCINLSLECRGTKTFRLHSYSKERLRETVSNNLDCLAETIRWNIAHGIGFFRISSDLVPFASHPVNSYPWYLVFARQFRRIGRLIRGSGMRISMHPDQFVLLNARDERIVRDSIRELAYHCRVLDRLGLDRSAKVQIHLGGVYGDKRASLERFVRVYHQLPVVVRRRLVIENDDRLYNVSDCLAVSAQTGIPVVFDSFHHEVNGDGSGLRRAFERCAATWRPKDGVPMVDYSSQLAGARTGTHAHHINPVHFRRFLAALAGFDFDLMLEIKDKERSVLVAQRLLGGEF